MNPNDGRVRDGTSPATADSDTLMFRGVTAPVRLRDRLVMNSMKGGVLAGCPGHPFRKRGGRGGGGKKGSQRVRDTAPAKISILIRIQSALKVPHCRVIQIQIPTHLRSSGRARACHARDTGSIWRSSRAHRMLFLFLVQQLLLREGTLATVVPLSGIYSLIRRWRRHGTV